MHFKLGEMYFLVIYSNMKISKLSRFIIIFYDVETIYNTTIKTFARLMYLVFLSRWSVLKRAANCLYAISELRFACVKRVFLKTIHMETCSTYRNIVITKVSRNDPFSNTGTRETRKWSN